MPFPGLEGEDQEKTMTVGVMLLPLGVPGSPRKWGPTVGVGECWGSSTRVGLQGEAGRVSQAMGTAQTPATPTTQVLRTTGLNIRQGFPKLPFRSEGMPLPLGVTGLI